MPDVDGPRSPKRSDVIGRASPALDVRRPDAVPYIESSDTPVRVLLEPFTADDLYDAGRDAITRASDLAAVAEAEIVRRTPDQQARLDTRKESHDAGAGPRPRHRGP